MYYRDVLRKLEHQTRVLVTGPLRAGTTITARILACELGIRFLPEETFGNIDVFRFWKQVVHGWTGVLQAPSMAVFAHYLPSPVRVVFVFRNLRDIYESEARVGWGHGHSSVERERARFFDTTDTHAAILKYRAWLRFQKPILGERGFDLNYLSLAEHPFWRTPAQRKNFTVRQTQ